MPDETSRIFQYWKERLGSKRLRLTKRREETIEKALLQATAEDLKTLIDYIADSEEEYALFLRGKNENNKIYTDLLNIFRISKLLGKLQKAKDWKDKMELPEDDYGWEIK